MRRGQVVQGDSAGASLPYDAWGLRTLLLQRLPGEFGGLYGDSTTLVLLVTRGHESEVEVVKTEFDASHLRGGRPTYRIDEVTTPLVRLEELALIRHQGHQCPR